MWRRSEVCLDLARQLIDAGVEVVVRLADEAVVKQAVDRRRAADPGRVIMTYPAFQLDLEPLDIGIFH